MNRSSLRNRVLRTGAVAVAVTLLAIFGVVLSPHIAFLARTEEYAAEFRNAAGVSTGPPVHVAGVPAGRVTDVQLAGDRVKVLFRLDEHQRLGVDSKAAIKIKTVLGSRYVQLSPQGEEPLSPGDTIPLRNTSVPYDLDQISRQTTGTAESIDTEKLRQMLSVLSDATPDDPQLISEALSGITAASEVINARGEQMQQLLTGTRTLTNSLLDQQETLVQLLGDTQLVVDVLNQRRETIRRLQDDIIRVTDILNGLWTENRAEIDQVLTELHSLSDLLARNEQHIDETIRQLGPASRYIANATGNGPWGDVSAPAGPIPDNLLCVVGLLEGCR
jgi:phospholipid/cholesterol/gamma-HCH transport system substrate-binding protein